MSDNYRFDLACVPLELCLQVAAASRKSVVGWAELAINQNLDRSNGGEWGANKAKKRLVLFWTQTGLSAIPTYHPFPAPMDIQESTQFVKAWLKAADYGREPDHDGDNGKSWRVYNESWGHVAGAWQAICAIEPIWALYGK